MIKKIVLNRIKAACQWD